MANASFARSVVSILPLLAGLSISTACGPEATQPTGGVGLSGEATACKPGQAQLAIRDGQMQALCGCAEFVAGTQGPKIVSGKGAMNCTVPSGTAVFFHYQATSRSHQVVSIGTPSFASSRVSWDGRDHITRVHVVTLSAPGTYAFRDAFDNGLSGSVVVQ